MDDLAESAHTDCTHAKSGGEGKKARAACRREEGQGMIP